MGDTNERLHRVEERLGKVENRLGKVENRLGSVESQLQKLWVLHEETSRQAKLIAEVQVHHGAVLDQLVRDIEPLKNLPDLLHRVVNDHERRITALEQRAGQ